MEEIKIGGIYRHYKGGYYKVINVAFWHEGPFPTKEDDPMTVVIYHKCDVNGVYETIRSTDGTLVGVNQPFYRPLREFIGNVVGGYPNNPAIKRFKLIK